MRRTVQCRRSAQRRTPCGRAVRRPHQAQALRSSPERAAPPARRRGRGPRWDAARRTLGVNMKQPWQFSLASLLLGMTAVAVACAVLPYPHAAFYTLCAAFFLAAILARSGPLRARPFWFWFSLLGWSAILLGGPLLEALERTTCWIAVRGWLEKQSPGPAAWTPDHYLVFGYSLVAICVALMGAILVVSGRGFCCSLTIGRPACTPAPDRPAEPETAIAARGRTGPVP